MADRPQAERQHFRSGGLLTGWSWMGLAVAVAVLYVVERDRGTPVWVLTAAACVAAVAWAVLLRPRVSLDGRSMELRNPFETVRLPLESVEELAVGRFLAVRADGRRWTSAALGRSAVRTRRDGRAADAAGSLVAEPGGSGGRVARTPVSYAAMVERRLLDAVRDARGRRGAGAAEAPVVRRRAWPEIAAVTVTATATVVLLLL